MPIIATISGLFSLYLDPKDTTQKYAKPLMLSFIIISGILTIFFSYQNQQEAQSKEISDLRIIEDQKQEISNLKEISEEGLGISKDVQETVHELRVQLSLALGYNESKAEKVSASDIAQSLEAEDQLNQLSQIETNPDIERRNLITVQYYPKDSDPEIVKSALENQGFVFKTGTSNPDLLNKPTNAIRFGDAVEPEDVKIVALILMRAGIKFQSIRRFDNPNAKPSKIEVITSAGYLDEPILTAEEISKARDFR